MKKAALFIAFLFSCTDNDRTISTLEVQGFHNIEITGYSWSCSDSDSTCTSFVAVGPTGKIVSGAVGCGRFPGCTKGCTIRFD